MLDRVGLGRPKPDNTFWSDTSELSERDRNQFVNAFVERVFEFNDSAVKTYFKPFNYDSGEYQLVIKKLQVRTNSTESNEEKTILVAIIGSNYPSTIYALHASLCAEKVDPAEVIGVLIVEGMVFYFEYHDEQPTFPYSTPRDRWVLCTWMRSFLQIKLSLPKDEGEEKKVKEAACEIKKFMTGKIWTPKSKPTALMGVVQTVMRYFL